MCRKVVIGGYPAKVDTLDHLKPIKNSHIPAVVNYRYVSYAIGRPNVVNLSGFHTNSRKTNKLIFPSLYFFKTGVTVIVLFFGLIMNILC